MTNADKAIAFISELRKLLEKYDAYLESVDSQGQVGIYFKDGTEIVQADGLLSLTPITEVFKIEGVVIPVNKKQTKKSKGVK